MPSDGRSAMSAESQPPWPHRLWLERTGFDQKLPQPTAGPVRLGRHSPLDRLRAHDRLFDEDFTETLGHHHFLGTRTRGTAPRSSASANDVAGRSPSRNESPDTSRTASSPVTWKSPWPSEAGR